MAIAGILVQAGAAWASMVRERLAADRDICEVRTTATPGQFVAVLEADSDRVEKEFKRIRAWDGVHTVELAYLTYEDELAEGRDIRCPPWEPRHGGGLS